MKLKPHKGVYKIRIYKTHGKRVPMSLWALNFNKYKWVEDHRHLNYKVVTDLTRVPLVKKYTWGYDGNIGAGVVNVRESQPLQLSHVTTYIPAIVRYWIDNGTITFNTKDF